MKLLLKAFKAGSNFDLHLFIRIGQEAPQDWLVVNVTDAGNGVDSLTDMKNNRI